MSGARRTVPARATRDPRGWARAALADGLIPTDASAAALALADELETLRVECGRTSRAIGRARAAGEDASSLLAAMRASGARANSLARSLCELAATARERPSRGDDVAAERGVPAYLHGGLRGTGATAVGPFTVHERFPAEDYQRYVDRHPARTVWHHEGLRRVITTEARQACRHLIARDGAGEVVGVLPLVQLRTRLFGHYLVSMPWFNYGGPLSDDSAVSNALLDAAIEIGRADGCGHLEVRETSTRKRWSSRRHKVSMSRPLPASRAALDEELGARVRSQASKAERSGCRYEVGGIELLDDFHCVLSVNMRDLGTPFHDRPFFRGLLDVLGDSAFLAVVRQGRVPVAAAFLAAHGDTLEIPWASSLRRANPLAVNMMLYRRTLGEAAERGYRHFDFGRSSPDSPTYRFKRQWGAAPHELHWHYWHARAATDGFDDVAGPSADGLAYRLAIAGWKRLPVALARRLGPTLVRGLP